MINWKDPLVEMPETGAHVWILIRHPKRETLLSCELVGVEVWERVNKEKYFVNNDDIGGGSMFWIIDNVDAWAVSEDINLPERT